MSYNQSTSDRSDIQYRRTRRSTGYHQQQQQPHRSSPAGYGRGAGTGAVTDSSTNVDPCSSSKRRYSINSLTFSFSLQLERLENVSTFLGIFFLVAVLRSLTMLKDGISLGWIIQFRTITMVPMYSLVLKVWSLITERCFSTLLLLVSSTFFFFVIYL